MTNNTRQCSKYKICNNDNTGSTFQNHYSMYIKKEAGRSASNQLDFFFRWKVASVRPELFSNSSRVSGSSYAVSSNAVNNCN
ncbi:MAG: hypothetical protein K2F88_02895, partial [Duncaniella sp.]|nr:hypothetical protein [Duncaniella sp.]